MEMIAMPANDAGTQRIATIRAEGTTPRFTVQDLAPSEILYALPLVRATWPAIDRSAWQDFVASFCADSTLNPAITALFDDGGGLCGLFASRIDASPGKRVLAVPLFTVVDIGNSLGPVQALVSALEAKARANNCAGINIQLSKGQAGLRQRLLRLRKEIPTADSPARKLSSHSFTIH